MRFRLVRWKERAVVGGIVPTVTREIVGGFHSFCRHLGTRRKRAVGRASGIVMVEVASRLEVKPIL